MTPEGEKRIGCCCVSYCCFIVVIFVVIDKNVEMACTFLAVMTFSPSKLLTQMNCFNSDKCDVTSKIEGIQNWEVVENCFRPLALCTLNLVVSWLINCPVVIFVSGLGWDGWRVWFGVIICGNGYTHTLPCALLSLLFYLFFILNLLLCNVVTFDGIWLPTLLCVMYVYMFLTFFSVFFFNSLMSCNKK